MRKTCHRRGFTLVELLVVIGVIAVLISMLLPALSRARASARSVKCMANLHQIGIGYQMYRNDNNNWFPPANSFVSNNANGTPKVYGIYNAIGPYVGKKEWGGLGEPAGSEIGFIKTDSYWGSQKYYKFTSTVFYCQESREDVPQPWYGVTYGESLYLQPPNSQNLTGGGNPKAWSFPRRVSAIEKPTNAIHIADSNSWHLDIITNVGITSNFDLYRHMKGTNILFVDGHVGHYEGKGLIKAITRHPTSNKSQTNFRLD